MAGSGQSNARENCPISKRTRCRTVRYVTDFFLSLRYKFKQDHLEKCLAQLALPPTHHKATGSTNLTERLFEEGRRRRTNVVGYFPARHPACSWFLPPSWLPGRPGTVYAVISSRFVILNSTYQLSFHPGEAWLPLLL